MKSFTATKDTIFQDWKKPLFATPKKKELKLCANCGQKPVWQRKKYCIPCYDYKETHGQQLQTTHYSVNSLGV